MVNFGDFWKPEICVKTVLPDRLIFIEQKLAGNCQNWKLHCVILGNLLQLFMGKTDVFWVTLFYYSEQLQSDDDKRIAEQHLTVHETITEPLVPRARREQ